MKYRILPRESVDCEEYPTYTSGMNDHAGKVVDIADAYINSSTVSLFGYYWLMKWMVPVTSLPLNYTGVQSELRTLTRRKNV